MIEVAWAEVVGWAVVWEAAEEGGLEAVLAATLAVQVAVPERVVAVEWAGFLGAGEETGGAERH